MSKKTDADVSIYQEYFQHTKQYQQQYGDRTVVLMQVGAFFEVYGVKNSDNEYGESKIGEFADICQLNISDKKAAYRNFPIVMAGFRDFTLDKYLLKLTEAGYTVPVFVQEKTDKEVTRKLHRVFSTGTYISCETDSSPQITNNVMCVWLETYKAINQPRDTIVYGVSVANIFTGKTSMFQYETQFFMNMSTFDELERYVSIYSPNEVIIISPFEEKELKTMLQLCGLESRTIHTIHALDKNEKVLKCSNQKYIKQILSTFFGDESYDICAEFHTHILATQSFCFLLNFMQDHNPDLVRKIAIPEFNNTSTRMILANHTLSQLNIIPDKSMEKQTSSQLSCVLNFLNKCCSALGKRKFQHQLLNPNFDEEWLNAEYRMISYFIDDNYWFIDMFRKQLLQMRDIEKVSRQLLMKTLYPSSIYRLHKTVQLVQQINTCLYENPEVCEYLCDQPSPYSYIDQSCSAIVEFLENNLVLDYCRQTSSLTSFDNNIIVRGVSLELDEVVDRYNDAFELFTKIRQHFNGLIQTKEKSADTDYVKIHETEKSGVSLQITNKRSQILKDILASTPHCVELAFTHKDVKFVKSSGANVDIEFPLLDQVCKDMLTCKEKMAVLINRAYMQVLDNLEKTYYNQIERISSYIAKVDVLQAKVYVAKQYNYCRPEICTYADKSFVDVQGLRHCLIEHLQQNEIYVTNDMNLGKCKERSNGKERSDGILLYGTNAVGKTSLIRALGISVIMAQSGMFVPCAQFVYKPYRAIFSRILGNDNIFKGLSTFAVEMTELRMILKMADENSLILGDELCSGTETESALSIFVAGLMNLHSKQSSFIFATHFHEIVNYDEIKALNNLSMKHMEVRYDREADCLVYDRKLRDGSGPKIYGLEVCKSLYLDQEFLDMAYSIRNKYYPETQGVLSHDTTTRYNSLKIKGMCEMCGSKMGDEIHHLNPQKNADVNGYIGSFHKNHVANLATVCEACHDKIHHEVNATLAKKKTTKGYKII
jgi:DNA mismatch repair protein MutS